LNCSTSKIAFTLPPTDTFRFVGTDELDLSCQAEGFELAFDCLEAAPQVGRDAGGAKLSAITQQFQYPLTATRWCVFDLNLIRVGFPGFPNRERSRFGAAPGARRSILARPVGPIRVRVQLGFAYAIARQF
jgi:hypothetical protein